MARITWERFQWRGGEDSYTFEVGDGGLYGTLTHIGGKTVTLPMVAWEGMLECLRVGRKAKSTTDRTGPERAGANWQEGEIRSLEQAFRAGQSIARLAVEHRRSRAAVEAQLAKLGLWNRLEHRPMQAPDAPVIDVDGWDDVGRTRPACDEIPQDLWPPDR